LQKKKEKEMATKEKMISFLPISARLFLFLFPTKPEKDLILKEMESQSKKTISLKKIQKTLERQKKKKKKRKKRKKKKAKMMKLKILKIKNILFIIINKNKI